MRKIGAFKCRFCNESHPARKCPAFGRICSKCSGKNHFAIVCRSSNITVNTHLVQACEDTSDEEDTCFAEPQISVDVNNVDGKLRSFKINDTHILMQDDSGTAVSAISSRL